MADILNEIVAAKRREVQRLKTETPIAALQDRIAAQPPPLNLAGALWGDEVRVIAEIKKASPSKGILRHDFDPAALARIYADNGAAAISVLTNADHFQGSIAHLEAAAAAAHETRVPTLRKEFIFDPYQIHEARAFGADAILLIAAILDTAQLKDLMAQAREFWMQCLVEVHNEDELAAALNADAEIIGINNRDLRTFKTDLAVTERLASKIPFGKVIVSESGISDRQHLRRVKAAGANAALIGESLITAPDIAAKLKELA